MMKTAKDSGFLFKNLVAYCTSWYHFAINPADFLVMPCNVFLMPQVQKNHGCSAARH